MRLRIGVFSFTVDAPVARTKAQYKRLPDYRSFLYFSYVFLNMAQQPKPYYNTRIFWDVDYEKLDFDAYAVFIIERVFERGDVEDIRNCRRYYTEEKITETLLNAKYLPETRLYLASAVIHKPIKEFKCYSLRLLTPQLFPY